MTHPEHRHLKQFFKVVRAAVTYYRDDSQLITDGEYDRCIRELYNNWDELTPWMQYILGDRDSISLFDILDKLTKEQLDHIMRGQS